MNRYVIHIKGSDRFDVMKSELDYLYNGEYKIFDAIVNESFPKKGISESFKSIVRLEYDSDMVHIFEDDVKFTSKRSREYFEESMKRLPDDWDIFLGGSYVYKESDSNVWWIKLGDFSSLHCVVIRKKAYDKILSHDFDVIKDIDRYMGKMSERGNLNVYLCNPMIAIQHEGYSYNAKRQVNYTSLLKHKNILHD